MTIWGLDPFGWRGCHTSRKAASSREKTGHDEIISSPLASL